MNFSMTHHLPHSVNFLVYYLASGRALSRLIPSVRMSNKGGRGRGRRGTGIASQADTQLNTLVLHSTDTRLVLNIPELVNYLNTLYRYYIPN